MTHIMRASLALLASLTPASAIACACGCGMFDA